MPIFPISDREKIDFGKPALTLDVNVLALRHPSMLPAGLPQLEWNYFETDQVELCVTPETESEIFHGEPISTTGSRAFDRFQKSKLFKSRPPGLTLNLSEQEANDTWMGMRQILFPTVTDNLLTFNQRSDVTQLFFHATVSGSLASSAFITQDTNFIEHATELESEYGLTIVEPQGAWLLYSEDYNLATPSLDEQQMMWRQHQDYFQRLRAEAESWSRPVKWCTKLRTPSLSTFPSETTS